MALGKHLIQAVPFVYALQCLTGKVDNNKVCVCPPPRLLITNGVIWCDMESL